MQQKEIDRWYPLKPHPVQLALVEAVNNGIRFPLCPAGRRSGKTERAKRFIVKQANKVVGNYFCASPTHGQSKKIFWDDVKLLSFSSMHQKKPSETELIIFMPNGSKIYIIGLDEPKRIEGISWVGGIIDEVDDVRSGAWEENIMPALNTVNPTNPDYRAWCWLIGVPDGLKLLYRLSEEAHKSNAYKVFHWKSSEILASDVIEQAKAIMSPKAFRQEYEASFETASGRIYEDYSKLNYTNEKIKDYEQLLWCHDFNYVPRSSCICVVRNNVVYALDEIVFNGHGTDAKHSALEFVNRFKDHKNKHVVIFGDPAGRAGEKHSLASEYTKMEEILRDAGWQFTRKVKPKAPAIIDRQNAVRAKILNAKNEVNLFVNISTCKTLHNGLSTVQLKVGSTFIEEQTDSQHITTALGYMIDFLYPVRFAKKIPEDKVEVEGNSYFHNNNGWMV